MKNHFQISSRSLSTSSSSFGVSKFIINLSESPSSTSHCFFSALIALEAAAAIAGLLSSASLCKKAHSIGILIFIHQFARMVIKICIFSFTCNAPMPAFPSVHIDGAAAKALANAFLQQVISNQRRTKQ